MRGQRGGLNGAYPDFDSGMYPKYDGGYTPTPAANPFSPNQASQVNISDTPMLQPTVQNPWDDEGAWDTGDTMTWFGIPTQVAMGYDGMEW